jgi:hypothetical protein
MSGKGNALCEEGEGTDLLECKEIKNLEVKYEM